MLEMSLLDQEPFSGHQKLTKGPVKVLVKSVANLACRVNLCVHMNENDKEYENPHSAPESTRLKKK